MSVQQTWSNKASPKFFLIKSANCNFFSTERHRTNPWLVSCLLLLLGFAEGCGNKSAAAAPAAPSVKSNVTDEPSTLLVSAELFWRSQNLAMSAWLVSE